MSFQDELRKSIPSAAEQADADRRKALESAEITYRDVQYKLKTKVAKKDYSVSNGMVTVSCVVSVPSGYLRVKSWDNLKQVAANNRKLFKDPFLRPNASKEYDIVPEMRESYTVFKNRLEELALQDGISVTMILYDNLVNWERPFPTTLRGLGEASPNYVLAAKCTTTFRL